MKKKIVLILATISLIGFSLASTSCSARAGGSGGVSVGGSAGGSVQTY